MVKNISRRNFLKRTACVSGGLVALLTSKLQAEDTPLIIRQSISNRWTIEKIDWPDIGQVPEESIPYQATEAHGINDSGEVVALYGWTGRVDVYMGVLIHRNGATRNLKLDESLHYVDPLGNIRLYREGIRINNLGDILVNKAIYKRNGEVIFLDPGIFMSGRDMNDNCDVVAYAAGHALLFLNGNSEDRIDLGFYASSLALNNNRQVIGSYYDKGYFWEEGVITHPVTVHGEENVTLRSINENGVFVGWETSDHHCWYKLWRNKGQEIEPINGDEYVNFINNLELVVGGNQHYDAFVSSGQRGAYLYNLIPEEAKYAESEGSFRPGWARLREATSVNNNGQIVGYGDYVDEGGISRRRGFVMTPVPLEGDLNNDNKVNGLDLARLANNWLEDWNYVPECSRCR